MNPTEQGINCVLTAYCGKSSDDGIVYGQGRLKLAEGSTIECYEKKPDTSRNDGIPESEWRAQKAKAAGDAGTQLVGSGKRCTNKGKMLSADVGGSQTSFLTTID
jgi:hypothetical protein